MHRVLEGERLQLAKQLRTSGMSYQAIARQLHVADNTVKFNLEPEVAQARNKRRRQQTIYKRLHKKKKTTYERAKIRHAASMVAQRPEPPPEVWAEAERVMAAALTPNMLVLGDPPPGRRALDRV